MRRERTAKRKELSATLKEIKNLHKAIGKGKKRIAALEGGLVKEEAKSDAEVAGEVCVLCAMVMHGELGVTVPPLCVGQRKPFV